MRHKLTINVKTLFYFCLLLAVSHLAKGQTEHSENEFDILKPPPSSIVQQHKENLHLTLIIDSITVGQKKIKPNFQTTLQLSFESDYIQVRDSLYIKIFIARAQEYGNKFYMWKWDFLKKRANSFHSQGVSQYETMDFNGSIDPNGSYGHGVGIEGTKEYIMYYYRYRLQ